MFTGLIQIDSALFLLMKERNLDPNLVLKLAICLLEEKEITLKLGDDQAFERISLSRKEFFRLIEKAYEYGVDPNTILSEAFQEALLEILRL